MVSHYVPFDCGLLHTLDIRPGHARAARLEEPVEVRRDAPQVFIAARADHCVKSAVTIEKRRRNTEAGGGYFAGSANGRPRDQRGPSGISSKAIMLT
jgi:2-methylisocitrate lyase-like PEP mutase family enzyme